MARTTKSGKVSAPLHDERDKKVTLTVEPISEEEYGWRKALMERTLAHRNA